VAVQSNSFSKCGLNCVHMNAVIGFLGEVSSI
jgi:hypothetical protein